ncbi:MAG: dethiobiotin synthase [Gammaproteobacteria bacterium]|jgi:dethiobiotin synthetase
MSWRGFFVTGTDTEVGKTLVSAALLRRFAERGLRTVGIKPVASGSQLREGRLVNEDALALQAAASRRLPYEIVNPYAFEPPIAPHIAASEAGVQIRQARIFECIETAGAGADVVIVEGVGGWHVPLGPILSTSGLAADLGLPVIMVVGVRLGCINHALLTAAQVRATGLRVAGWVANCVDPAAARREENIVALRERLDAPLLGVIPPLASPSPELAGGYLELDRLSLAPQH